MDPKSEVISVDQALMRLSLDHYAAMSDKEWGLTDCISFIVMRDQNLQFAATSDHHFRQAGFFTLLNS